MGKLTDDVYGVGDDLDSEGVFETGTLEVRSTIVEDKVHAWNHS